MHENQTFLAIIPARSGSKGLPGKNIKNLCGKPLIAWTIESALKSKYLDEVIVSTDSEEIAIISRQFGATLPFIRPAELATDTATSLDVVIHCTNYFRNECGRSFDYIVLLEPTSPLREDDDIDSMIEKLLGHNDSSDSIISIGEVNEHPSIMKRVSGNELMPFCSELEIMPRRQDNECAYFPYGVAYITKFDALLEEKTFYTEKSTFYKVKRYQCYEIDDICDFLAIENIMSYRLKQ